MIKVLILIEFFSLCQSKQIFMPNLPLGEYRLVLEKMYACEQSKNYSVRLNVHFRKKTLNITELKGNFTSSIDIDDTLIIDANAESWGTTGGWKPNSVVFISKKACSISKNMAGKSWITFINGFNISTNSCPLPAGTYSTTGIDLKLFEDNNFPKVYFYGKYKMVYKLKNTENIVVGCWVIEFSLVRPWEVMS